MQNWKRWLLILLGVILIPIAAGFIYFIFKPDLLVDYWWFKTLGYAPYFLLRLFYRYVILFVVTLFFFLIFFFNFWIASGFLGSTRPKALQTPESKTSYKDIVELFRSGSMKVYTPLSLILAIIIAFPLFEKWQMFLFYIFGPKAGLTDPAYGHDVSFYLFSYPIYILLQQRLLFVLIILLSASLVLYWIERRMLSKSEEHLPGGARIHLNILAVLLILLGAWSFLLQRFGLLYDTRHMPLFFGPGYTQMNVTLPLIWASLTFLLLTGLFALIYINRQKALVPAIISLLLFFASFGLQKTTFLTDLVQKYLVLPNELTKEAPYITNSIEGTLAAYDLTDVETRQFNVEALPWVETAKQINKNIENIPVWDRPMLDLVYDQLQGIRPYYNFTGADVDRYVIEGRYQQVNLAAREINMDNLPGYARSWINRRLQYTHGYGVVMTPAAQIGEQLLWWYIKGITPQSVFKFPIAQPAVYYGQEDNGYVIAPNEVGEMNYPVGDSFAVTNYKGSVGVPLDNLFRKLIFAVYFKDRNIFFTTKTNNDSKILFRRNFRKAIYKLTPYFQLDRDPYLVVTNKGLFWIQDAYTRSKWFPYAAPFDEAGHNYIRNSVKIVIDAYNGTINYYIAYPEDPIIRAYSRFYPGLLKPLSEMPAQLLPHIRYPKDIFIAQMGIYNKYHQTNPSTFYREEDIWEFAERAGTGQQVSTEPYYVTLNLIERDRKDFLLLSPMSPKNRPNLRSIVLAGCDGDHYGKFYVYSFPKGEQVYGPAQINALIDQDPTISEQFTLWNQVGSEVKRGRMIIVPMGDVVFYIQPVYLTAATKLKIPQLQRLIVSHGEIVVMDVSLEQAFNRISQRVRARSEGIPLPQEEPEQPEEGALEQGPAPAKKQETKPIIENHLKKETLPTRIEPEPEKTPEKRPGPQDGQ